jgi:hypothetical protein
MRKAGLILHISLLVFEVVILASFGCDSIRDVRACGSLVILVRRPKQAIWNRFAESCSDIIVVFIHLRLRIQSPCGQAQSISALAQCMRVSIAIRVSSEYPLSRINAHSGIISSRALHLVFKVQTSEPRIKDVARRAPPASVVWDLMLSLLQQNKQMSSQLFHICSPASAFWLWGEISWQNLLIPPRLLGLIENCWACADDSRCR